MFYIIAQGARIITPIDQLVRSKSVTAVASTAAVKAVSKENDAAQEKVRQLTSGLYGDATRENRQSPQRSNMRFARDIMTSPVLTASAHQPLRDIWHLMASKGFHHLPIVDSRQQLQGIVSDRDLLRFAANENRQIGDTPIEQLMTRRVISADAGADLRTLADIMCSRAIGAIPIVGDGTDVIGIVSRTDILRGLVHGASLELWA